MNAPRFKTRAEQHLEWLDSLSRPLTDEESEQLRRSLHAVYCHNRRQRMLAKHRKEELELLAKVEAESRQLERYPT
jgi:hypothetical protein